MATQEELDVIDTKMKELEELFSVYVPRNIKRMELARSRTLTKEEEAQMNAEDLKEFEELKNLHAEIDTLLKAARKRA